MNQPHAEYARSFGTEAERYDRVRPGYPAAAIDFALAGRSARHVLDLGAGTGKLTAGLLGRADQVSAVEPDEAMLAVLMRNLPSVRALAGGAGEIPLPDNSVDAVLVGQAFHWFPRPAADHELARVLRPGGVVGLLWNFPDREVEWVRKVYDATGSSAPPWSRPEADLDAELFTPTERANFHWRQEISGEDALLQLASTWSWVIIQSPVEQAATADRLRILRSQYAELQQPQLRIPQRTKVIRQFLR